MKKLLFIAIITVILSTISVVDAYTGECESAEWPTFRLDIICYLVEIHEQNDYIIEKLDWNNCAIINKSGFYENSEGFFLKSDDRQSFSYEGLVSSCGEMP